MKHIWLSHWWSHLSEVPPNTHLNSRLDEFPHYLVHSFSGLNESMKKMENHRVLWTSKLDEWWESQYCLLWWLQWTNQGRRQWCSYVKLWWSSSIIKHMPWSLNRKERTRKPINFLTPWKHFCVYNIDKIYADGNDGKTYFNYEACTLLYTWGCSMIVQTENVWR